MNKSYSTQNDGILEEYARDFVYHVFDSKRASRLQVNRAIDTIFEDLEDILTSFGKKSINDLRDLFGRDKKLASIMFEQMYKIQCHMNETTSGTTTNEE